jgi:hypothetical protein
MLQIAFLVPFESSRGGGVHRLAFMAFWLTVKKFLNIEWFLSLKIKLNHSWNFWRYWNVPLVLLERSGWAGFNGIYLVRFGFRMWEILILKWYLPLKIQINSKKLGFGRKNQLRTWWHLGRRHMPTLVDICIYSQLASFWLVVNFSKSSNAFYMSWYWMKLISRKTRGVSHCGLAIYMKRYLKAKEELWKLKYFTMQKYILQKIL